MMIHEPCTIVENTYYCNKNQVQPVSTNCIANIILNNDVHCETNVIDDTDEIDPLQTEYLYVSSKNGQQFTTNCREGNGIIKGRKLLHYKNCTIKINNIEFNNENRVTNNKILIIQPFDNLNLTINNTNHINLPKLSNWTIQNDEQIKIINQQLSDQRSEHFTIFSGYTITVLLIFFIIAIFFRKHITSIRRLIKNPKIPVQVPGVTYNNEDVVILGREELCDDTTPDVTSFPSNKTKKLHKQISRSTTHLNNPIN